ncbi:glycoside hydrolase family 2 protein [Kineococcus sp. T13]|uniref:glycoside hydrolase family 2 protein n=1 Tax=Kineococcus vitellinus TaxID=2696565 RepID=UPI00141367D5|nr:glycoside hydrolase family 2 protein [Kineococcus vitellinus]NAZ75588.1 glycoside hydrolase family 2 protein [Kineococcus vitellinus]
MDERTLHEGWTLEPVDGDLPPRVREAFASAPLPARVPGSVHTDLLAAGAIDDPYAGLGEQELEGLHRSSWDYRLAFEAAPAAEGERVDLDFAGLDTVATVVLNDRELGRTANMHRSHRFAVAGLLREGRNELLVRFSSALEHAEAVEKDLGARPRAYGHPFNAVRKMACSFGWDWGPDLQTAGVWRPVVLRRWRTARIAAVRPLADLEGSTGVLRVHVDLERCGLQEPGELAVRVRLRDLPGREDLLAAASVPAGARTAAVELRVPDAPLWWPVGHGEQPLVHVDVELALPGPDGAVDGAAGGEVLDRATRRTAFRSVRLDTAPDEHGSAFTLLVNDVPIAVRGVNWIPEDHLLTRLDRGRCAAALERALEAHCNLVRVWGGGIYESDDFYDVCDERGLLVWQDFLLACAAYAEEEPLRSEIEAEARENVARLSAHPSLVVWNGGNENLWGHEDWGWKEQLGGSSWGLAYYEEVFPAVLAELDPSRAYTPGSPSSQGAPAGTHPNDPDHGSSHEWNAWNSRDWSTYRDRVPRFCSEFGWQAPPTTATLAELLEPADRRRDSAVFLLHQKAEDGNGKLDRGMAPHFGVPAAFADWTWAAQLNQARAVSCAVEHFRSWWPRTAGSVYWQLNDCWPVTSWAVVDGAGRRKPAFHALRHAHAPRLATIQPRGGTPHLLLVNDTATAWTGRAGARRVDLAGRELAAVEFDVDVPPRSVGTHALPGGVLDVADPTRELLVADVGGTRAVHAFAEDRDLGYDPEPLRTAVTAVEGGYAVRVRARAVARDVTLLADAVAPDAVVDDALVTLLAGESRTFSVRTRAVVDPAAFSAAHVLRSANGFGSAAGSATW